MDGAGTRGALGPGLRRLFNADDKTFSQRAQGFDHCREFSRVFRIENAADFLFVLPHAPTEFALSDPGRAKGFQYR